MRSFAFRSIGSPSTTANSYHEDTVDTEFWTPSPRSSQSGTRSAGVALRRAWPDSDPRTDDTSFAISASLRSLRYVFMSRTFDLVRLILCIPCVLRGGELVTDTWDPSQYNKYQREREQPFYDVLALVKPAPGMVAVDLGCGTGSLTRKLHEALGARRTLGIDRSARMLEDAGRSPLPPGLRFEVGDMNDFAAKAEYDLIFSNAAFHWVLDHEALIGRLAAALKPGGQLAFQIPASHDTVSHLAAEELTSVEPFATGFAGWHRPQPVLMPDEYAELLYRAGFPEPRVSLTVYTESYRESRRANELTQATAAWA